jgi:hypothetical protein
MRDARSVPILTAVVVIALLLALADIITRDDSQVKHLHKMGWVLLVIFLPLIGTVLWFSLGRDYNRTPTENISFGDPRRWNRQAPEAAAAPTPSFGRSDSRSTEEQLADLEAEIEFYRTQGKLEPGTRGDA